MGRGSLTAECAEVAEKIGRGGDEDWVFCLGSGNGRELGEKRRDWETGKVGGRLPYERGSDWVGLGEPFYLIHGALVDDGVHGRSPIQKFGLGTGWFTGM